ncbi:MAG: hypothetical protein J6V13_03785 [Paludibacteraceae bacterium]|nr:hypothetical protein [Paludibacteraceae bacterium]
MNTITICDVTEVGRLTKATHIPLFVTSWCWLMNGRGGKQSDLVHFWYPIDFLAHEVWKRSSYLGKYRKSEDKEHLLEEVSMSADERDLFIPYIRAAMADVFDKLVAYTGDVRTAFLWDEGHPTVPITEHAVPDLSIHTLEPTPEGSVLHLDVAVRLSQVLQDGYRLVGDANIGYVTKWEFNGSTYQTEKSSVGHVVIDASDYDATDGKYHFSLQIPLDLSSSGAHTSSEEFSFVKSYTPINLRVESSNPKPLVPGTWIEYKDQYGNVTLYKVLNNTDTNADILDDRLFEQQPADFRHSVHYIIRKTPLMNHNVIEPVDVGLFEALVNCVLFKWLLVSLPSEAEIYGGLYQAEMDKIGERLKQLNQRNVMIIPRPF